MTIIFHVETRECRMPEVSYCPNANIIRILDRRDSKLSDEEIISRAYAQLHEFNWDYAVEHWSE